MKFNESLRDKFPIAEHFSLKTDPKKKNSFKLVTKEQMDFERDPQFEASISCQLNEFQVLKTVSELASCVLTHVEQLFIGNHMYPCFY